MIAHFAHLAHFDGNVVADMAYADIESNSRTRRPSALVVIRLQKTQQNSAAHLDKIPRPLPMYTTPRKKLTCISTIQSRLERPGHNVTMKSASFANQVLKSVVHSRLLSELAICPAMHDRRSFFTVSERTVLLAIPSTATAR